MSPRWLKLIPTPNCPVSVSVCPEGPGERSKATPLHGGWLLLFAALQEKPMPVLAPQPCWGWRVLALAAGPALSWSGQGAAGSREREGGSRTRDPQVCPLCSCLFHSAFLIKISLRMIHTGESVWMDSLTASSGPKDGSTSPSATPLENEPIWM